jgi:ribosomal protein S17E
MLKVIQDLWDLFEAAMHATPRCSVPTAEDIALFDSTFNLDTATSGKLDATGVYGLRPYGSQYVLYDYEGRVVTTSTRSDMLLVIQGFGGLFEAATYFGRRQAEMATLDSTFGLKTVAALNSGDLKKTDAHWLRIFGSSYYLLNWEGKQVARNGSIGMLKVVQDLGGHFTEAAYACCTLPTPEDIALFDSIFNLDTAAALASGKLDATSVYELRRSDPMKTWWLYNHEGKLVCPSKTPLYQVLEIIKGFGGLFAAAAYTGGRSTVPTANEKALLDATYNLKMSEALVRGELDATKALELRSLANLQYYLYDYEGVLVVIGSLGKVFKVIQGRGGLFEAAKIVDQWQISFDKEFDNNARAFNNVFNLPASKTENKWAFVQKPATTLGEMYDKAGRVLNPGNRLGGFVHKNLCGDATWAKALEAEIPPRAPRATHYRGAKRKFEAWKCKVKQFAVIAREAGLCFKRYSFETNT